MNSSSFKTRLLLIAALSIVMMLNFASASNENLMLAAKMVRMRGYIPEEHNIETRDGYRLNLVRVINPKVKRPTRIPVIFTHGIATTTTLYIINTEGGWPEDLTSIDASKLSENELDELIKGNPTSKSVPFLMSNLGHDVWLFNRRASSDSLLVSPRKKEGSFNMTTLKFEDMNGDGKELTMKTKNLATRDKLKLMRHQFELLIEKSLNGRDFDENYWNFNIDDQAEDDYPRVVHYIIGVTNWPKVSWVAHSLGAGLTLMSLIARPDLNDKFNHVALLGPALHMEPTFKKNIFMRLFTIFIPTLTRYKGPLHASLFEQSVPEIAARSCELNLFSKSLCNIVIALVLGKGVDQMHMNKEIIANIMDNTGSNEFAQLLMSTLKGKMRKFDHLDASKNIDLYGRSRPPRYNAGAITAQNISFWLGNADSLCSEENSDMVIKEAKNISPKKFVIGSGNIEFNHAGFFLHKQVIRLFVIPLVRLLEQDMPIERNHHEHEELFGDNFEF